MLKFHNNIENINEPNFHLRYTTKADENEAFIKQIITFKENKISYFLF